jgi:hypothetical protein
MILFGSKEGIHISFGIGTIEGTSWIHLESIPRIIEFEESGGKD